ncbi:MAG: DUF6036 family nucleotidyltransferase [Promethearchaeota archaeon]
MPEKKESNKISKKRKNNSYIPYYSEEFRDIVRFIQDTLKKYVYLAGVRAMFEHGIPVHRMTQDFDVYAIITTAERDEVTKYIRKKYETSKHIWRKFGFGINFYPTGRVSHLDVNTIRPKIMDESWEEELLSINGVDVYLPPLEDLIALKMQAGRKKDIDDITHTFHTSLELVHIEQLKQKAIQLNVLKKLIKLAKKYGVSLE